MILASFHVGGDVLALGLVTGMLYGILGVGLVLVYRASRIINFAYGDIGAFGAALLAVATQSWGIPYWLSFVIAVASSAAMAAASEILIIRRLRNAPLVLSVIATLGLGQILQVLSQIISGAGSGGGFGLGAKGAFPQPVGFPQFNVGALLMTPAYTAMMFLTPGIVVALMVFLRRGRLGIAMRASSVNPDAARMAGMMAGRLSALAWAISGALAAFTAILVLPAKGYSSGEFLGPDLLLRALACAVVGRMVNLPVALATGIGLGVVEQTLLFNYPNGGQVEMLVFVIILAALLLQRRSGGRGEDKGAWSSVQAFPSLPLSYLRLPAVRRVGWRVAGVVALVGLVVPELSSNASATTFSLIAAFGIVGLSVALVTGLAGQLSLGQFAIAGVGAVTAYRTSAAGAPFIVSLLAAAASSAAVSLVIGLPALRIRGLMLAVATLGFALASESWLLEQKWMLGTGVLSPHPALGGYHFNTGRRYYLVAFGVTLAAFWLARNIWNGGVGRRLRAVRDNEDAARAFSVPATSVKLQAFVLGGVLAGLGGAVYGSMLTQQTSIAYPVEASINVAAVAVIGGLGLLAGPLLGSLYIIGVPHWLPLDNVGVFATAAGWLGLIVQFPGGLGQAVAPLRDRLVDRFARQAGLDPERERTSTPAGGVNSAPGGLRLERPTGGRLPAGEVLLRVEGVTKRFGGLVAVNGVDVEVRSGETLGLIGPNGAGKTTLFELLGGFTRPDDGTVTFAGRDITDLRPEERARIGLIRSFQDAALFPTMTVHESVMVALERAQATSFFRSVTGLGRRADREKSDRADDLLGVLGLASFRDVKIAALSTGTRRITELACLVALEPILLLLDEPTSGIAQRETEALGGVLSTIKHQLDLTLVIIEHDIPLVMGLSDRVVAMESGRVLTSGSPAEVQANPEVISSYLGGDPRAIERSGPSARTRMSPENPATQSPVTMDVVRPGNGTRPNMDRCRATTREGGRCRRPAGEDGLCGTHRKVLSQP